MGQHHNNPKVIAAKEEEKKEIPFKSGDHIAITVHRGKDQVMAERVYNYLLIQYQHDVPVALKGTPYKIYIDDVLASQELEEGTDLIIYKIDIKGEVTI